MKPLTILLSCVAFLGCSGTPPTPEQVNANAAHTAVHGSIQDYKDIKKVSH